VETDTDRQAAVGQSSTLTLGYLACYVVATAQGKQVPACVCNII